MMGWEAFEGRIPPSPIVNILQNPQIFPFKSAKRLNFPPRFYPRAVEKTLYSLPN